MIRDLPKNDAIKTSRKRPFIRITFVTGARVAIALILESIRNGKSLSRDVSSTSLFGRISLVEGPSFKETTLVVIDLELSHREKSETKNAGPPLSGG